MVINAMKKATWGLEERVAGTAGGLLSRATRKELSKPTVLRRSRPREGGRNPRQEQVWPVGSKQECWKQIQTKHTFQDHGSVWPVRREAGFGTWCLGVSLALRRWSSSPSPCGTRFFFTGPLSHFFYLFMEHWIPPEVPWAGLKRLLLDRLLFAPAFLLLFFLVMSFLEVGLCCCSPVGKGS